MKKFRQDEAAPEEASGPGTGEETHECEEGKVWDPETEQCVVPEESEPDIDTGEAPQLEGESATTVKGQPKNLMDAIIRTIRQMNEEMYKKLRAETQRDIERIRKEIAGEAETALRKSVGLEVDPALRLSDFKRMMREYQLDAATKSHRSPKSPSAGVGPDGNTKNAGKTTQAKKIESLLKEYKGAEN